MRLATTAMIWSAIHIGLLIAILIMAISLERNISNIQITLAKMGAESTSGRCVR